MNKELVIELAGKVDPTTKLFLAKQIPQEMDHETFVMFLQRFFQLATEWAAEREREQCAKVCDARYMGDNNREDMEARRCAAAIRARGESK